jgi:hypothetical protein
MSLKATACSVQQALQRGIVVDERLELAGEVEACAEAERDTYDRGE